MKKVTKFKYENVAFGILAILFIFGGTTRDIGEFNVFGALANFYTVLIQLMFAYGLKLLLWYIRKNPEKLANELRSLFLEN